jgi:hypothetical protein
MNHQDFARHNLSHIHTEYQDAEAVLSIPDGQLLAGDLPRRQKKMVEDWIALHNDELVCEWNLAITLQQLFTINALEQ